MYKCVILSFLLFLTCGILNPEEKRSFKVEKVLGKPIEYYTSRIDEISEHLDIFVEIELINYRNSEKIAGNVKFIKMGWEKGIHEPKLNNGFFVDVKGKLGPRTDEIGFFDIVVNGNSMKGKFRWGGIGIDGADVTFTCLR